jgi:hypothetical protein
MTDWLLAQSEGTSSGSGGEPAPPDGARAPQAKLGTRRNWLREPKSAVWIVLAAIVLIGGGRRLLWSWRARKAVARLSDPDVTAEELEAVADFGRAGAWELLRIFSTTESESTRAAAGLALARIWRDDHLVAEEEKAVVRRGFAVTWSARRRYPRALYAEIPIVAAYGVPFLSDDRARIRAEDLEWSHRIVGARRAALEDSSPWKSGRAEVAFTIVPDDFPTNGPHRLVLQSRVRTIGLSDSWELDLPHVPFQFDFDPILRLDAILTLSDATRDEAMARSIRLESAPSSGEEPARLVQLGGEWVLRNPPRLAVDLPLPCDLAHAAKLEFEGTPGRYPAGSLIVSGQGLSMRGGPGPESSTRGFDVHPLGPLPSGVIDRPGARRIRVHLAADSQLGWADPDIRSVWPGTVETNWVEAEIIRK